MHGVELVQLVPRDPAVGGGKCFHTGDLALTADQPARLATGDLAAGDAAFDALFLACLPRSMRENSPGRTAGLGRWSRSRRPLPQERTSERVS
jgi:hypothetical protein